jgi:hypothetical protein
MESQAKHEIRVCFIYTLCTQPEGPLIEYFYYTCAFTARMAGVEFSTWGIMSALKKFQIGSISGFEFLG